MQRREFITFLGAAAAVRAKRPTALLREAGYLLLGLVSLATVTGLYFWLDGPLVAAAFTFLVVLVLLSLVSNLSSLIVLSFIGVGCLSYFFAPPIYSFRVDYAQDLITISAFVITSFVVNFLVTRVRDANQRLEVTNEALRIENVERRRAEQAQRESEDKLRQIIETGPNLLWSAGSEGKKAEVQPGFMAQVQAILNVIPAHTWYASPSGGLTFVNKRTADYLGLPKDHPLRFGIDVGAQWDAHLPFVHPDDRAETQENWSTRLRTGEGGEGSFRVRNAQGGYRWFLSRAEPLRASDGTILQWVGVNLDIEELKFAEDALRASERDLRSIIRTIPTMVWSAAPDGSVDFFNPRWLDYTGLSPDQSRDWRWSAAIHPDDLSRLTDAWQSILVSGESGETEARVRRFDGAYRWFLFSANPLRDESGNIVKWYGINLDIEDRKRAEEAFRRSESYLAEAQRLSQTGSWAWSPDQDITYWSEECYRVLSFDPQDGLPRFEEFFQRIHPDDQPSLRELIQTAIREKAEWEVDYRIVHLDGSVRDIHVVGHPVLSTSDHLVEFVGTVIDVTERRRAEQERARLSQLEADLAHVSRVSTVGEMAASLAHEVKQPMAAAHTYAAAALRFLDKSPPDVAEVREALTCIVNETDRANNVVDRIGSLIKKAPPRKEVVDLNAAILEVTALTRSESVKTGVRVGTQLAGELPRIQCDRVQLQQVMLNLIVNAIQSMSDVEDGNRELHISTVGIEPEGVCVAVRDTGHGLRPESLPRLFEPFYTTKPAGMGMGLSICRSIIEAHGGRLWATRCEPRGALFQFTIPAG